MNFVRLWIREIKSSKEVYRESSTPWTDRHGRGSEECSGPNSRERGSIVGCLERDPHGRGGGSLFCGSLRMSGGNSKSSMAFWFPEAEEGRGATCVAFMCLSSRWSRLVPRLSASWVLTENVSVRCLPYERKRRLQQIPCPGQRLDSNGTFL